MAEGLPQSYDRELRLWKKTTNCWEISKQITRLGMTVTISVCNWLLLLCAAPWQPDERRGSLPSAPIVSMPTGSHPRQAQQQALRATAAGHGRVWGCQPAPAMGAQQDRHRDSPAPSTGSSIAEGANQLPRAEIAVVTRLWVRRNEALPPNNFTGLGVPSCELRQHFSTREYQVFIYSF